MSTLTLKNIRKSFGDVHIIKGIELDIQSGEFVVFVGPSGCGKSTLLRMISGLETTSSGIISIRDRDVTHVPPARRGIAMVFQSYALFPHMSVADNITFGLRLAHAGKDEITKKLAEVADILQLTPLLDRRPKQLSGGQRQRVAIGRAIIRNPDVFLFDEPLSNLDAALRVQMRLEIASLHQRLKATMIYVTHDQVEAMTLADRIVVLNEGRIEQVGAPIDLYEHPANRFVAQFIGSPKMNFLAAKIDVVEGRQMAVADGMAMQLSDEVPAQPGEDITVGIRPESLAIGGEGRQICQARIAVVERLGSETIAYAGVDGQEELLSIKLPANPQVRPGDLVPVTMIGQRVHVFGRDGISIRSQI
ncbi:ABC transporter ATP-binding protein [Mesorhizobium qingshengii]|uniref:Multiple sugar transport system ATP-binding protein n=1 Tax=Mesorhizobium qingshengii TaxID=1165689 RepID=A0A1G5ZT55_9HYPH|nr:sn-glycerol-3-phosphate ABC transporter ATP-binding protein UgpC [Mesorhizobium qingshengii]SDA97757.1 multiple sugar transport system ATP-binding protein [Mesorhizobium qingshengii]